MTHHDIARVALDFVELSLTVAGAIGLVVLILWGTP